MSGNKKSFIWLLSLILLLFFYKLDLYSQNCPVSVNFTYFQVCGGDPVRFRNMSNVLPGYYIVNWFWDFGDGTTHLSYTNDEPEHQYIITGKVPVKLVVTLNTGCKDSLIDTIVVKKPLLVNLGSDFMLCGDEKLVLSVQDTSATCIWSTGETGNSITVTAGIKSIWVIARKDDCEKKDTINILMCDKNVVGVPSAFTPNGDGYNDVLYVYGNYVSYMDFRIFNRYGQMVFRSNDLQQGWDGTYAGTPCEMEVYTYYLYVEFFDGHSTQKSGNITLIR